jgi:hypothetical protein
MLLQNVLETEDVVFGVSKGLIDGEKNKDAKGRGHHSIRTVLKF